MIGSVAPISAALAPAASPRDNDSRLLDNAGAAIASLDAGRGGLDAIKAALTNLRDALQSARGGADAVPGLTTLAPVVAQIEQTQDKPTYVDIDGEPVQTGTITVTLGTRPLIVGYERVARSAVSSADLKSLAGQVAALVSNVGGDSAGGFASDVSALLRSNVLATALTAPDAGSIDAATAKIDDTLAKAEGLRASIGARASAAAQVDLGGILLAQSSPSAPR